MTVYFALYFLIALFSILYCARCKTEKTRNALLCWTVIVPIAAAVVYVILLVLKVIAFFSICSGKAKEPAIIRNLGFLK